MPERAVSRSLGCNAECQAQVEAAKILAASIDGLADRVGPAADAVAHLGEAQKKLCGFILKHRLKLMMSIPVVLTSVGAITPEAEHGLHTLLAMFGAK